LAAQRQWCAAPAAVCARQRAPEGEDFFGPQWEGGAQLAHARFQWAGFCRGSARPARMIAQAPPHRGDKRQLFVADSATDGILGAERARDLSERKRPAQKQPFQNE